ncbi:hypothetical protein AAFN60_18805 [Roseibacillus persicicus]|uniref:hypothetical protein n=1 Tax=Roseibacillus persicicus TaxID=454148 RepID=UPI00398ABD6D
MSFHWLGVLLILSSCAQKGEELPSERSQAMNANEMDTSYKIEGVASSYPKGKFGIGSSLQAVLSSVAKPDHTQEGTKRTVWYFDDGAIVTFIDGTVTEWSNPKGSLPVAASHSCSVKAGNLSASDPLGRISESHSMASVCNLAGIPNRVVQDGAVQRWYYVPSRVVFRKGSVT